MLHATCYCYCLCVGRRCHSQRRRRTVYLWVPPAGVARATVYCVRVRGGIRGGASQDCAEPKVEVWALHCYMVHGLGVGPRCPPLRLRPGGGVPLRESGSPREAQLENEGKQSDERRRSRQQAELSKTRALNSESASGPRIRVFNSITAFGGGPPLLTNTTNQKKLSGKSGYVLQTIYLYESGHTD